MRYTSKITLFLATLVLLSARAQVNDHLPQKKDTRGIGVLLRYGQHSDFWKQVDSLKKSDDPVAQTLSFMDKENYGAIEGIAKAQLEVLSSNEDFWTGYFDTLGMGFNVNSLAGGEVYNRISPKVRGYLTWDLSFFTTLSKKEAGIGESGWSYLIGTNVGIGRQKIVEGEAIDFLVETPVKESTLYYVGADLGLGYKSQFSDYMRLSYKGLILPTYFYSQFDEAKYSYGVKKGIGTLRWRTEIEQTYSFQAPKEGGFEIGGQLFGGQQPTPVRILPRVWDSIHKIEVFPDYGTLVGFGGVLRAFTGSRKFLFSTYGGFYGGYFGAGANLNVYGVTLEAGRFSYEQTSKYRLRESRILYASLGYNHEW